MAYHTYTTEALVCGERVSNTSDKVYLLFTKEAGMLYAHAKSVREEKSKHRYSLQPFSHARVTLVRGKTGWKLTGSESIQNFFSHNSRETRSFSRNILLFLRRVLQGEVAYPRMFDEVIHTLSHADEYELSTLETVVSMRILHLLGYVAPHSSYNHVIHSVLTPELCNEIPKSLEKSCIDTVKYALLESQL